MAPAGARGRIHVFVSSSEIHLEHQMRKQREQVLPLVTASVQRAKSLVRDVEFSPMDATRTEPEFLARMVQTAIEAGATTVNIPDTVGIAVPEQFAELISYLRANVPQIDDAIISVHCHNDLGMAVANSLAAVRGRRAPRSRARSMASASARATRRWKKSSWRSRRGRTFLPA